MPQQRLSRRPCSSWSRAPLWLALFASGSALAQPVGTPAFERKPAAVYAASAGQSMGRAAAADHRQVVASALRTRGRDDASLAALRDGGVAPGVGGMTHRRFEQAVGGLPVHGAYAKAAFNAQGELVHLIDHLATVPAQPPAAPATGAQQAVEAAMRRVHVGVPASFRPLGRSGNAERFDGGAFFHQPPQASEVVIPHADGTMTRGWLVQLWTQRRNLLDHVLVGSDGAVLDIERRTANDSYNAYPVDPGYGPQTVMQGPGAGNTQSPSGWLGTGTQTTINILGNNVNAYLDVDANNRADRGGTTVSGGNFLTAANLAQAPTTAGNRAVAVQNLFYLNNVVHDILYRHGFNEAAGNFQTNNFGKGGAGNDPVNAEAQDGSGTDNANFATPADGKRPRMQMYLWTGAGATHEVQIGTVRYAAAGAEFGPALTTTGVSGTVARATPADGCTAVTGVSGRIALIDRGTCDFVTKVANAQAAGATGAIIANNQGGTDVFTMGGTSRARISSVMVSQNDGNTIKALVSPSATMRRKAEQPLQLDASLDSDIVYHEYCHGLTWRMIGSMSGPMSGAIGEGMSDGCALLINGVLNGALDTNRGDVVGEYSAANALGIRSRRYAGYSSYRTYADVTGANGVHFDGEVYGAIVWRMLELFGAAERDKLFGYVVNGMNYTAAAPKYENMRDGILQGMTLTGAPRADVCKVWTAFAELGVGAGASGTVVSSTSVTTVASFTRGDGC